MDEYADGLHSPVIFTFILGRLRNLKNGSHLTTYMEAGAYIYTGKK